MNLFKDVLNAHSYEKVEYISTVLEGTCDDDSIHVQASFIFGDDIENSQKLLFILEALYRAVNILYINEYVSKVDSFFWEEPYESIDTLNELLKKTFDDELLMKFHSSYTS